MVLKTSISAMPFLMVEVTPAPMSTEPVNSHMPAMTNACFIVMALAPTWERAQGTKDYRSSSGPRRGLQVLFPSLPHH